MTLPGETALLTVAIRPEKAADFEQVMGKMKSALLTSEDPKRREQAAGWNAFPDERQVLYELYRGAFVQNLSLATGHIVLDMSKEP